MDAFPVPVLRMPEDERGQHLVVLRDAVALAQGLRAVHDGRDQTQDRGAQAQGNGGQHGVVADQVGILVVGHQRPGQRIVLPPRANDRIEVGDTLIAFGDAAALSKLINIS